jgi:hypothetical protein
MKELFYPTADVFVLAKLRACWRAAKIDDLPGVAVSACRAALKMALGKSVNSDAMFR